ncbi:Asparagine synthetase domain-containing protein 1 [Mizuhopecten yessoensis]|uniref:Asparagine synthetase domain-containing protein 1 n=1 Tax=Mizuhopecten yessoensis TaxID=6573 RepID=A0A210QEU6_MIZYE|nr:Asparagine synthetase domain-containing protein 1 [Mizuhopecten yessoensis]
MRDFIEKNSRIGRRGPDCSSSQLIDVGSKGRQLFLQGHVLHLRGELTPQPLQDHHGNMLLWNGEIFGGLEVGEGENDTQVLLRELSGSTDPCHLLTTMAKVQGPWAFIYWEEKTKCLWFGRDMFGRRSLLWHIPQNRKEHFVLSSTQIGDQEFREVPSVGIYSIHFPEVPTVGCDLNIHLYQREESVWPGTMDKVDSGQTFQDRLWSGQSEISPVKFSMDTDLKFPSQMPKLNKALPNMDNDLEKNFSDDLNFKQSGSNIETVNDHQKYIENLIQNNEIIDKLADQLIDVLQQAVRRRIYNQPYLALAPEVERSGNFSSEVKRSPCSQCKPHSESPNKTNATVLENNPLTAEEPTTEGANGPGRGDGNCGGGTRTNPSCEQDHPKVAILFSGGIDSARWNVPDRLTGYSALAELNPRRRWNFIQVNVSLPELQQVRSNHVRHLVYPLDTVLDDSIGCAVWFAARGQGVIGNGARQGEPYTSTARVILCGMGADEQLAGYSRHRGRFSELGWQGLLDEVELEITRISARNLGRDDRIITDHGKESRFPFLDEEVVKFLSGIPMQYKVNLDLPRGLGEKLLLRVCATKLGLLSTAVLPKRAIQFGSRIAKMENNKEKASDKCKRLAE